MSIKHSWSKTPRAPCMLGSLFKSTRTYNLVRFLVDINKSSGSSNIKLSERSLNKKKRLNIMLVKCTVVWVKCPGRSLCVCCLTAKEAYKRTVNGGRREGWIALSTGERGLQHLKKWSKSPKTTCFYPIMNPKKLKVEKTESQFEAIPINGQFERITVLSDIQLSCNRPLYAKI